MKKLKNKVFFVICIILTIFLISILLIVNFQNYYKNVNSIKSNLMRMNVSRENDPGQKLEGNEKNVKDEINVNNEPQNVSSEENPQVFMDSTIYTVLLDEKQNVKDIINHTTENISDEEITKIAENIIKNRNDENLKIGNLYFTNYSYAFDMKNTSLIIVDNTNAKTELIDLLKASILIFVILEIVIVISSKQITNWIIKPVEESFNKQKQFIQDASHELKTPLAVIIASSEALENNPNETKWLGNIKEEAENMNNLVSDLLEMAKSENKVQEQYLEENLSKLVQKSVLTFESLIYEKNIKLTYNIAENIVLKCDSKGIKQVVGILMDNAIKHSCSNGEIIVNLKKDRKNIILDVTNKGKEISKEQREKIFERFYRADESRNRSENRYGLGLAIAKNIVNNHNGKILVNCENGYTTFKIIF